MIRIFKKYIPIPVNPPEQLLRVHGQSGMQKEVVGRRPLPPGVVHPFREELLQVADADVHGQSHLGKRRPVQANGLQLVGWKIKAGDWTLIVGRRLQQFVIECRPFGCFNVGGEGGAQNVQHLGVRLQCFWKEKKEAK